MKRICSCRSQMFLSNTIKNVPKQKYVKIVNFILSNSLSTIPSLLIFVKIISEIPIMLFESSKYWARMVLRYQYQVRLDYVVLHGLFLSQVVLAPGKCHLRQIRISFYPCFEFFCVEVFKILRSIRIQCLRTQSGTVSIC